MAEQDDEKKLDLTSRLVDSYQKANEALLERVSIMKSLTNRQLEKTN